MPSSTNSIASAGVTESVAGPRAVRDLLASRPRTTALAIFLLTLAVLSEGVGLAAILPLLSVAVEGAALDLPGVGEAVVRVLEWLRLEPTLGVLLMVIVGGIAAKASLKILALWRVGAAEAAVTAEFRRSMIEGFLRVRWPYFVRQPSGSLTNAVGVETRRAAQVFTMSAKLAAHALQLAVYGVLAVLVSWQVALIGAVVGIGAGRGLRFLVRISKAAGKETTRRQNALLSRLGDCLYTIKPLKAMGRERSVSPMLEDDIRGYERAQRRTVLSEASVQTLYEPIAAVALAVLMYVLLALLGYPFEELLFVAFLLQRTVMGVGKVQNHWQQLQNHQYALQVVSGTLSRLHEESESAGGHSVPSLAGELRFEDVSFSYDGRAVLTGFSVVLPANQVTAVVGPSGAGKTTLIDLVIGLQQPDSGRILVDGVPLANINMVEWRRRIGYVPQETVLFHDTIRTNLALGDETLTDADLEEALSAAGGLEFVRELPEGLDAVVGEHGLKLSGGQRQRLAIARALVRRPLLLILDEATTALDPETERTILSTVESLRGRMTVLAISHQAGITASADRIVEIFGPGREPGIRPGGAGVASAGHPET